MRSYSSRRKKKFSYFGNWSVVSWIIVVNAIFYFILLIIGLFDLPVSLNYFALDAEAIFAGKYWWTLLVHMFSHVYLAHIFLNMFALFSFGGLCERIIGRKRFFWFYLIAGLFAGLLSVVLSHYFGYGIGERIFGSPNIPMLGASGAIFGVAGLLMMLLPKLRFSIIFFPFFSMPAYIILPSFLVVFWILSILFNWPIGNVAHFGGFLVGVAYGYYLRTKYQKKVEMLGRYFR